MTKIKARVLLVDDNKDAVDIISELLRMNSIETEVAYDGYSAVEILTKWPAHIVFLDIQMPGMNGYETAVAIHALPGCANLPIVAWTGWDGPGSRDSMSSAKMVRRLSKPVVLEEVFELIDHYTPSEPTAMC